MARVHSLSRICIIVSSGTVNKKITAFPNKLMPWREHFAMICLQLVSCHVFFFLKFMHHIYKLPHTLKKTESRNFIIILLPFINIQYTASICRAYNLTAVNLHRPWGPRHGQDNGVPITSIVRVPLCNPSFTTLPVVFPPVWGKHWSAFCHYKLLCIF